MSYVRPERDKVTPTCRWWRYEKRIARFAELDALIQQGQATTTSTWCLICKRWLPQKAWQLHQEWHERIGELL